jgi:uncharacterized protein (DUF1330 family)
MHTKSKIMIAVVVGVAIGAAATQGLNAQAKLKAYSIAEVEVLNPADLTSYVPPVRKKIGQSHGRSLRTLSGRVVRIEGSPPPKNVAIVEWDSVDDAMAFY